MPDVKPSCLVLLVALGCGGGARPVVVAPAPVTVPAAPAPVKAPAPPAAASEPASQLAARRPPPPTPDTSKITATGTLSPLVTIEVTSPSSGKVVSVSVDTNMPVKKGQVLAQIGTRKAVIRAPIDGIVLARHIEVGWAVALGAGGVSPSLFTIASDPSKLDRRPRAAGMTRRKPRAFTFELNRQGACPIPPPARDSHLEEGGSAALLRPHNLGEG